MVGGAVARRLRLRVLCHRYGRGGGGGRRGALRLGRRGESDGEGVVHLAACVVRGGVHVELVGVVWGVDDGKRYTREAQYGCDRTRVAQDGSDQPISSEILIADLCPRLGVASKRPQICSVSWEVRRV